MSIVPSDGPKLCPPAKPNPLLSLSAPRCRSTDVATTPFAEARFRAVKVLLFGSSANPPTGMHGHAGLVDWAAKTELPELGGRADEVWVLPVFRHAFAEKDRDLAPYADRIALAKLAFEGLAEPGRVKVKTTEQQVHRAMKAAGVVEPFVGTIDVVRALEAEHPTTSFALLLGADTYEDLTAHHWKESEELLARVPVVVVPRIGVAGIGARADGPMLGSVSSRALRASRDPALWAAEVQPQVLSYIRAHRLYGLG